MGAVFDGKTKVGRVVADPGTDDMLPNPGSLAFPAINTPVAVSGTIGAETRLVHGDRWQQISGTQTENIAIDLKTAITGNHSHAVTGNQNLQIAGNATHQIASNLTTTIIGAEIRANIGVQNFTHAAPKSRVHAGNFGVFETGEFFRYIAEQSEAHQFKAEATLNNFEAKGVDACVTASKMEATYYGLDVTLFKTETEAVEIPIKALENKVEALQSKIKAARAWVGGAAANMVTSQLFLTLLGLNQIL